MAGALALSFAVPGHSLPADERPASLEQPYELKATVVEARLAASELTFRVGDTQELRSAPVNPSGLKTLRKLKPGDRVTLLLRGDHERSSAVIDAIKRKTLGKRILYGLFTLACLAALLDV